VPRKIKPSAINQSFNQLVNRTTNRCFQLWQVHVKYTSWILFTNWKSPLGVQLTRLLSPIHVTKDRQQQQIIGQLNN
jgi:hypothetical protein